MNEQEAYIHLLRDTLKRKVSILESLLAETREQQILLSQEAMDVKAFEKILTHKKEMIDELNEMDEGFDSIYKRVSTELQCNIEKYGAEIAQMQSLIRKITDLGLQIQALEHKNSEKFKLYVAGEKSQIRDAKANSRMASSYYQNMANQHQTESSYFFNTKK